MSGSSRQLQREINQVFDHWSEKDSSWNSDPSPEIKNLYGTIYAYKEKHNTNASVSSSSIHNEIRSIYNNHIKDSLDLSKETFYVEILVRLVPVLQLNEVDIYLQTYLKPALDSAGYDHTFVQKTKELVRAASIDIYPTDDGTLQRSRRRIAFHIMKVVLNVYLDAGHPDNKKYNLYLDKRELDTHAGIERSRFMEKNSAAFLTDFCFHYPSDFFNLVNAPFCNVSERLRIITLLSLVISTNASPVKAILETPLWINLLRSIQLDLSEATVACGLSALVMLIGKVCDKLSDFAPDLFALFCRLSVWPELCKHIPDRETKLKNFLQNSSSNWKVSPPDLNANFPTSRVDQDDLFDLLYFGTLLYGLFPVNFTNFISYPFSYWEKYPPQTITEEYIHVISKELPKERDIKVILKEKFTTISKHLIIHPNIVNRLSETEELSNPLKWYLEENEEHDVGEQDVMLGCLHLNLCFLAYPNERLYHHFEFGNGADHDPGFSFSSKERSTRSPKSEDKVNSGGHPPEEGIRFKNVDFGGHENGSRRTSTIETSKSTTDLFNAHEKLYVLGNSRKNSVPEANFSSVATGSMHQTPKSASKLLNEQLGGEKVFDQSGVSSGGSALEFYQRELLIYKNEVDFADYMKQLNKYNYMRMKAKINKMKRENPESKEEKSKFEEENGTKEVCASLSEALQNLRIDRDRAVEQLKLENTHWQEQVEHQKRIIDDLRRELFDTTSELEKSKTSGGELEKILLQYKQELEQIKYEKISGVEEHKKDEETKRQIDEPALASTNVDAYEKEIFNLKTELDILRSQNSQLSRELEDSKEENLLSTRTYEKQIATLKLDMTDTIEERCLSHEQKITELNRAIKLYESSLEEKSSIIMHLTSSRPMEIPGSGFAMPISKPEKMYYDQRNSVKGFEGSFGSFEHQKESSQLMKSSSSSNSGVPQSNMAFMKPHTPSKTVSNQSIPIVRGRGGYQKRSKKM